MNNLDVITTTSDEYATAFGFTEKEVFNALDGMGLGGEKEDVKKRGFEPEKYANTDLHSEEKSVLSDNEYWKVICIKLPCNIGRTERDMRWED